MFVYCYGRAPSPTTPCAGGASLPCSAVAARAACCAPAARPAPPRAPCSGRARGRRPRATSPPRRQPPVGLALLGGVACVFQQLLEACALSTAPAAAVAREGRLRSGGSVPGSEGRSGSGDASGDESGEESRDGAGLGLSARARGAASPAGPAAPPPRVPPLRSSSAPPLLALPSLTPPSSALASGHGSPLRCCTAANWSTRMYSCQRRHARRSCPAPPEGCNHPHAGVPTLRPDRHSCSANSKVYAVRAARLR